MNIIQHLTSRIEKRLLETKNPCKSYTSMEAADKALAKMSLEVATYHHQGKGNVVPAQYVVFYMEKMGRYVGAIDLSGLLNRDDMTGGYLGLCADKGFYTY